MKITEETTLKNLRIGANLTQEELARRVGVTVDYISMIERSLRRPSDKIKNKIAEELNVSPEIIFLIINRTICS